jgi:hypothetical protein
MDTISKWKLVTSIMSLATGLINFTKTVIEKFSKKQKSIGKVPTEVEEIVEQTTITNTKTIIKTVTKTKKAC